MNDSYEHDSFDWWLATLGGFAFLHNGYTSTKPSVGKYCSCLKKNKKIQVEHHPDSVYGIDMSFDPPIPSQALHW